MGLTPPSQTIKNKLKPTRNLTQLFRTDPKKIKYPKAEEIEIKGISNLKRLIKEVEPSVSQKIVKK